jgi:hypothetical protein
LYIKKYRIIFKLNISSNSMEEKVVEQNSSQNINIRREKIFNNIKKQLKKPEIIAIIIILISIFIVGIYYFNLTKNQALWYDEGTYLGKANQLAFGTPMYPISAGRALLEPFIWSFLFKIGFSEVGLRFLKILLALIIVFLVYNIGKEMFNKWIGLFAAFSLAANWVFWYTNTRMFPDEIGIFFWMLLVYLFYKGFICKESKPIYAWMVGPVFALGIYARELNIYFAPVAGLYFIISSKFDIFKNKNFWIAVFLMIIMFLPFFYYYQTNFGNPVENIIYRAKTIKYVAADQAAGIYEPSEGPINGWNFIKNSKDYMGGLLIILFIIGLPIFLNLILGLDMYIKGKIPEQNVNLFLLLLIFVPFFMNIVFVKVYDERYLYQTYPALFYVAGNGMYFIFNLLKKYSKIIGIIVVAGVLIMIPFYSFVISWGGGPVTSQFERGDSLIKGKINSYWQAQAAGLWLKDNSDKNDRILAFTDSPPQINYYSKRDVFVSYNLTNLTKFINQEKPKYLYMDATTDPATKIYIQENMNAFKPVAGWPIQKDTSIQQGNIFSIMYLIDYNELNTPKTISNMNNLNSTNLGNKTSSNIIKNSTKNS